ncbi:MAG: DEAD/DEAH box helicase family protein [Candidatus Solibacter sp.]|nr:DEAD/DEAH box helicase family protein [Candidatus Solibacter sp.]
MSRNETQTCRELIEPALRQAGWAFDRQLELGPGPVNLSGGNMYDDTQRLVVDYLLRIGPLPLAILEAKAETEAAADGMQQGSRYANRLGLRFSIASNGTEHILTDNQTGAFETLPAIPTPDNLLARAGRQVAWETWKKAFETPWHVDQVSQKRVRPYQQMAIYETMFRFAAGLTRVLLLMATGTGKTFTVFQLIWKLINGGVLANNHILFLTDRNNLQDQAWRAFSAFASDERVVIDKEVVRKGEHQVGKIFFANYQNLDEELDGKKLFEHYPRDFFDLVIVDECHRSGFGDWFPIFQHFDQAFQLGLTATPREIEDIGRPLSAEEQRRDTYSYFTGSPNGEPAYTYSLKQAIEDGYLVPYLLEERLTNLDENGYIAPDGTNYTTSNFERDIRLPERTKVIAEDLWAQFGKQGLREEKAIVFCVDDTHAAFMAQELRRVSGDDQYAGRITRSERNSHQLERNFAEVGRAKPRVAVTVDLLTTGFDAPDVKAVVFVRPVKSAILYKQMKGRGTRLCQDIDKRYFFIFDYTGASQLEDAEFDGHPANRQKPVKQKAPPKAPQPPQVKPVGQGIQVYISSTESYVCLADGRKLPFDEYRERSKEVIRKISPVDVQTLLDLWIDKSTRKDLRMELKDNDIHVAAFRKYFDLDAADDVDILSKVGFDLVRVPMRTDRVVRFWDAEQPWLVQLVGSQSPVKVQFWETCLDHYALYGIDDLEQGQTYSAPQFVERFGNFSQLLGQYGGGPKLRTDLEEVKRHLYVPMAA